MQCKCLASSNIIVGYTCLINTHSSKADVKRLKKNATQKQRELKKNKSLNELRDIIIKYKNIQPKGRRRFTEVEHLHLPCPLK